MPNQENASLQPRSETTEAIQKAATAAFAKASEVARDATSTVTQTAADATSTVNEQVRELLDKQISQTWNLTGQVAGSFKLAADDLASKSPFAANLVRNVADNVEQYAQEFQGQTVEQVVRAASDLTRRQPALVFGLAAVAGFFAFRTLKAQSVSAPPIAPGQDQVAQYD